MRKIAVLMLLFSASHVHAQTVDQTFLYLMNGVEDGEAASATVGGTTFTATPFKDGRLGITLSVAEKGNSGDALRIVYTKVDNCHYEAEVAANSVKRDFTSPLVDLWKLKLNFSKVSDFAIKRNGAGSFNVLFTGMREECEKLGAVECKEIVGGPEKIPFINFGDPERVRKAYAYFQKAYCSGSAY